MSPFTVCEGAFFFVEMNKLYEIFKKSTGISTDTRSIKKGQVFFALKGGNFNGNLYAQQALDAGASFAVIDEENGADKSKCIFVDDVLRTLQELSNHHRKALGIPVIGITGSNGKTTTKELLRAALNTKFKSFVTPGNFNNHIGVPLSLLQIDENCEVAAIELGDNHQGEIEFLCKIAEPDMGYITNLGKDHIEGFGSYENNVLSKKELFDYLQSEQRLCFVNDFDPELKKMSEGLKSKKLMSEFCGEHGLTITAQDPFLNFELLGTSFKTNLIGGYNLENIQAALFLSHHFQVTLKKAAMAISEYSPDNNRSEFKLSNKGNRIFLDAYNANPSSMELALDSFLKTENPGNSILILGDMLELGALSNEEHQALVSKIESMSFQNIFLVGAEFSKTQTQSAKKFTSFEEVNLELNALDIRDRSILLKGSRGIRLENCLTAL